MTRKRRIGIWVILAIVLTILVSITGIVLGQDNKASDDLAIDNVVTEPDNTPVVEVLLSPIAIQNLRDRSYPGGEFVMEQQLSNGTNYSQTGKGLSLHHLCTWAHPAEAI